ncbi:heavy metal-binding protein [Methylocaldum sp. BRCS4]|jgi:mercuric reductase|uniref:cation transporter n=1 Tax=Methylocaldum sp. 14B TaxID=1912213 RepID=UPI00098A5E29|nr:cation transporter [Methylocaldum sp. 14B]MVF23082.1 heavy metal-binding protein [Methylocaldum sp. BRCS4]
MKTITLRITGMTCDHCAADLKNTLNALPGVKAEVSYGEGVARVEAREEIGVERLLETVKAKGYGAERVE